MKGQRINGVEIITKSAYRKRIRLVYASGQYARQPALPNAVKRQCINSAEIITKTTYRTRNHSIYTSGSHTDRPALPGAEKRQCINDIKTTNASTYYCMSHLGNDSDSCKEFDVDVSVADGIRLLHLAIRAGDLQAYEFLVNSGARLTEQDDGGYEPCIMPPKAAILKCSLHS